MKEKKKWSKPECEKVKLATDEAVLVGCKTRATPVLIKNKPTCSSAACKTIAS